MPFVAVDEPRNSSACIVNEDGTGPISCQRQSLPVVGLKRDRDGWQDLRPPASCFNASDDGAASNDNSITDALRKSIRQKSSMSELTSDDRFVRLIDDAPGDEEEDDDDDDDDDDEREPADEAVNDNGSIFEDDNDDDNGDGNDSDEDYSDDEHDIDALESELRLAYESEAKGARIIEEIKAYIEEREKQWIPDEHRFVAVIS